MTLSLDTFRAGFQLDHANQLSGVEERLDLVQHLSVVLKSQSAYFGLGSIARPGNLIGKDKKDTLYWLLLLLLIL